MTQVTVNNEQGPVVVPRLSALQPQQWFSWDEGIGVVIAQDTKKQITEVVFFRPNHVHSSAGWTDRIVRPIAQVNINTVS